MTVESVLVSSSTGLSISPYDGTASTLSSLPTEDYQYSYGVDNMFSDMETRYNKKQEFGSVVNPLFTEHNSNDIIDNYMYVNITDSEKTSVNKFMNIYVNYKKEDDDSITLYFNYNNYLATPYVKIDNGKIKTDIIQGTYLKLKSGESDVLDILVQFKYYEKTELYGYKNFDPLLKILLCQNLHTLLLILHYSRILECQPIQGS